MEKEKLDAHIISELYSLTSSINSLTKSPRLKGRERFFSYSFYAVQGRKVCRTFFARFMGIGLARLKALKSHLKEKGPSQPRTHGNEGRLPKRESYAIVDRYHCEMVKVYLENFANRFVFCCFCC